MGLTIPQIRKNTQLARGLMTRSRREHFAVGAFNVDNQETLIAICRAARAKHSPVLIEASHGEINAIGHDNLRDMVDNYRDEYGLEIYLNLDHSPSIEAAKRGIDAGFEFVHIDISQARVQASLEEIISDTIEVVEYARFTGAVVESEPHFFAGSSEVHSEEIDYEEIKKTFSTPDGARYFVDQTGIDTYAVAVGNLHGVYPGPKILDIELLASIRSAIDINISLHGGSGTPQKYFRAAVKTGVSKINVNSDLRLAFRSTLDKVLADNPHQYAVMKLMPQVYCAVQEVVEDKIDMFGSSGKAQPN